MWMAIPKVPYYFKDIMLSNSSFNSLICSIVYIHSVMLTFSLTADLERNTQICLGFFFVRICR